MPTDAAGRHALAVAIREWMDAHAITPAMVRKKGGPHEKTLASLLEGHPAKAPTLHKLDRALAWGLGASERIMNGTTVPWGPSRVMVNLTDDELIDEVVRRGLIDGLLGMSSCSDACPSASMRKHDKPTLVEDV